MNAKAPIDALVTETEESERRAAEEENRVLLHMPVDIRSVSLAVLANGRSRATGPADSMSWSSGAVV